MGSAYQVYIVFLAEFLDNVLSEYIRDPSFIGSPPSDFLRISPQEVTKQSLVWDILWSLNCVDYGQVIEFGRKASMHAENPLIDNSRYGEHIEHCAEVSPQLERVSPFALIVEPVHSGDRTALVITPQHEEHLRILNLESQKQA